MDQFEMRELRPAVVRQLSEIVTDPLRREWAAEAIVRDWTDSDRPGSLADYVLPWWEANKDNYLR